MYLCDGDFELHIHLATSSTVGPTLNTSADERRVYTNQGSRALILSVIRSCGAPRSAFMHPRITFLAPTKKHSGPRRIRIARLRIDCTQRMKGLGYGQALLTEQSTQRPHR
jgi:hypothetical protein